MPAQASTDPPLLPFAANWTGSSIHQVASAVPTRLDLQEYRSSLPTALLKYYRSHTAFGLPVCLTKRCVPQLTSDSFPFPFFTVSSCSEVDQSTRSKLEELVGTWRNGGPDRRELFKLRPDAPPGTKPAQQIIDETIWGRPAAPVPAPVYQSPPPPVQQVPRHQSPPVMPQYPPIRQSPAPAVFPPPQSPIQPMPRPPTPPQVSQNSVQAAEKAAVLFELRKMLTSRREQAVLRPADKNNSDQIVTLMAVSIAQRFLCMS